MNAEEARKITEENLKGLVIEPLLKIAYERIKTFAEEGRSSLPHPFHGAPFHLLHKRYIDAALLHLQNQGYRVFYHEVRSEDPREVSYWEIFW